MSEEAMLAYLDSMATFQNVFFGLAATLNLLEHTRFSSGGSGVSVHFEGKVGPSSEFVAMPNVDECEKEGLLVETGPNKDLKSLQEIK
jgi:hypothetical protein